MQCRTLVSKTLLPQCPLRTWNIVLQPSALIWNTEHFGAGASQTLPKEIDNGLQSISFYGHCIHVKCNLKKVKNVTFKVRLLYCHLFFRIYYLYKKVNCSGLDLDTPENSAISLHFVNFFTHTLRFHSFLLFYFNHYRPLLMTSQLQKGPSRT